MFMSFAINANHELKTCFWKRLLRLRLSGSMHMAVRGPSPGHPMSIDGHVHMASHVAVNPWPHARARGCAGGCEWAMCGPHVRPCERRATPGTWPSTCHVHMVVHMVVYAARACGPAKSI